MNRMHEFPSRVTTTDSHSFRVLLEKRKFLIETGPERERERGIVYQILEYRYREQKSQLFPSNPLQPLRNFLETSLSKHCSHYFASIYANIIERDEEKFEIFRIYFSLSMNFKKTFIRWNQIYQLELHVDQRILSISTKFPLIDNRHCRSLWRYHPNYRGGDKKREYGFKFHTKLFNRILCGRRPLGALR